MVVDLGGTKVPKFMSVQVAHIVIKLFTFFLSTRYICTGVHMFTLHIAHSSTNVPNESLHVCTCMYV